MYEQTEGTVMGSPLSPFAANIFMEYFEDTFVMSSVPKHKLWIRYMDDCLVLWKHGKDKPQNFLNYLNSCHDRIKLRKKSRNLK